MIAIETLLSYPLPVTLDYSGKHPVQKRLKRLTIAEWTDLKIGFLSEAGSKAGKTPSGECMWILDIALNYDLPTAPA